MAVLVLAGCGGEDGSCDTTAAMAQAAICEAGKTESCPCPGGTMGAQSCNADGSKWGECACADPDSAKNTDPTVACSDPADPQEYAVEDRCPSKQLMFASCSAEIVASGVCYHLPGSLLYCCITVNQQ